MRIKDIVLIGMLTALLIAAKFSLSFLPNIELVSLFIIIYTLTMHKKTLYIITVFVITEGLLYGFGLWFLNYLYIWYILYILVRIFRKNQSPLHWAIISGGFGLSFGALCAIPYFFIGLSSGSVRTGLQSAFAYWISGILFDIPHGIGNFIITLVLFKPLMKIFHMITASETHY
ncbi:MAG: Energy-coupling factor transport system substrate-specific component [Lachnoclostridium sp.]|jgi:energy-coupling factor transport system substrate-specific component